MVTLLNTCLDINGLLIRLQSRDHHLFIFVITNMRHFLEHMIFLEERGRGGGDMGGREQQRQRDRQKKFMSNAFQPQMQIRYFGF